jgi:hypothetical protein
VNGFVRYGELSRQLAFNRVVLQHGNAVSVVAAFGAGTAMFGCGIYPGFEQ